MKTLTVLALALACASGPALSAADEPDPQQDAEKMRRQQLETLKDRMKYFESHVGEWTGEEKYEMQIGDKSTTVTRDEWKGLFSLGGTHFEMHGEGVDQDGKKTTYKWICTYDVGEEKYRAWYFDSNGNASQFEMEWDDEEKALRWTEENEEEDFVSTFTMKVVENEITGHGETSRGTDGETLWTQTMKYRRKRIRV